MAKYVTKDERVWETATIVGHEVKCCVLWNDGSNVSAFIIPISAGENLGHHRHETWVQVFVIEGKIRVLPDDRVIEDGGYYFVEEGDEHTEIAEEDSLVLIIRDEPNKQYPI